MNYCHEIHLVDNRRNSIRTLVRHHWAKAYFIFRIPAHELKLVAIAYLLVVILLTENKRFYSTG